MAATARWYQTTMGKKTVMAVTGLIWVGYVIVHLIGNLNLFVGQVAIDGWAEMLHSFPPILWAARIVLIISFVLHVVSGLTLVRLNAAAGAGRYQSPEKTSVRASSRSMRWTGPVILGFVLIHLAHLTLRWVAPHEAVLLYADGLGLDHHSLFVLLVTSFQIWYVALFYMAAMAFLGFHLVHGVWSMFQTLGFNHSKYNDHIAKLAVGLTALVVAGNVAIPLAVLFGIVG